MYRSIGFHLKTRERERERERERGREREREREREIERESESESVVFRRYAFPGWAVWLPPYVENSSVIKYQWER